MQTIAILGAAGRFGEAAALAFLKAGWRVRGIARGPKLKTLAAGVEPVEADAYDRQSLIAACKGADVILHALNPAYDQWDTTVLPLAENVLAAAQATGATVMIPGNVYNFGSAIAPGMKEDDPANPDTQKGRLRVEMEALFANAAEPSGVRTIVIRAGDFFGGKRPESWLDLMILKDLGKDKFTWPGPRGTLHAFAYLPDLAETFVQVAEKRAELPPFERLHFKGYAVTGSEMQAATEQTLGRDLKQAGAPWMLLRLIGLFNPVLREVAKMSYLWRVPHSLDNSRLEALIGLEPHRPLARAIGEAVTELGLDSGANAVPARDGGAMELSRH
ncbi:NmrA family NAD(P)-binding protein [Oricola sp.]|uniref:NmrA family NAD(P)-binding protein n=1 Tax=Oricola sp. TaxID=1979950 RepID=UPI003BA86199